MHGWYINGWMHITHHQSELETPNNMIMEGNTYESKSLRQDLDPPHPLHSIVDVNTRTSPATND
jgi:hypothetical protein